MSLSTLWMCASYIAAVSVKGLSNEDFVVDVVYNHPIVTYSQLTLQKGA